tara:strand:+ start:5154 stop:5318 length:165 start_codon:yes stop_codon:yes gene_type:complete
MLLLCHFIAGRELTQKMLESLKGTDLLILWFGVPFMFTFPAMLLVWSADKLNEL